MAPVRLSADRGADPGARRTAFLWTLATAFIAFACLAFSPIGHAQQAKKDQAKNPGGWSLCNQTSYILEAATGRPDGRAVVVQGWIRLRPGQCGSAAPAPLARGVHYVYARTVNAHRGGRRQWGGDAKLCIDPSASFAVENPPSCEQMGLEERDFRRVQINKRDSWRTSFAEANPYTLFGARSQGLQRLLADAGYDARTASGRSDPRLAATAIQRFRQDAKLSPAASEDQLIDALETAARRRAAGIGLTLCNRTSGRVWSAVARRRGEGWESRGWWPLGPGACARAVDDPLVQSVYFVHAVMETPQGERYLAAPGTTFCTSPTKFAILSRDRCAERYYDETLFTPISSDGREGLVVEFFDADFLPVGARPQASNAPIVAAEGPTDSVDPDTGHVPRGRAPGPLIPGLAKRGPDQRTTVTMPAQKGGARPAAPKQGAPPAGPSN